MYIYVTHDCGTEQGEAIFIYGKDFSNVSKALSFFQSRAPWQWKFCQPSIGHVKKSCNFMQKYLKNFPLADAINADDFNEKYAGFILRHYLNSESSESDFDSQVGNEYCLPSYTDLD